MPDTLHIGINLGFGKLHGDGLTDQDMYAGELAVAVRADELGYDSVWAVEHHFEDYSLCPDNLLLMAHLAARTQRVKLGTGAVILPWNNPIRVAEKALMLDTLAPGRLLLGVGRGLSRKEFRHFGIDLAETRERFDEAAPMIFEALETGVMRGDGPYYPVDAATLRPQPHQSFKGRRYCVAGSPDSLVMAAQLEARLMSFIVRPVPDLMESFTRFRELYEEQHGEVAPPISLNVNMYCHEDDETARERHFRHVNAFFLKNIEHYEMAGTHFEGLKGHERYAANAEYFRSIGLETAAENYAATALWGSPERVLGQIEAIRDVLGDFELVLAPSFGGMPYDQAMASIELFAREVMPQARGMRRPRTSLGAA